MYRVVSRASRTIDSDVHLDPGKFLIPRRLDRTQRMDFEGSMFHIVLREMHTIDVDVHVRLESSQSLVCDPSRTTRIAQQESEFPFLAREQCTNGMGHHFGRESGLYED
jgi:hypothetical protein